VLARVTDMRGIDIAAFTFDFDLTFAALSMHPDGTIYHRYGGRTHEAADRYLATESLVDVLERTLEEHAVYAENPSPPPARPPVTVEGLATYAAKHDDDSKCIHCHEVYPALRDEALAEGTWSRDAIWSYPPPSRIGVELEPGDSARVASVHEGSPAAAAGVLTGDRLLTVAGVRVAGLSDVSYALHETDWNARELGLELQRGDERLALDLPLPEAWKRGTPLEFSWRPTKWGLKPAPGFGGKDLEAEEKRALGIAPDALAFRVDYIVDWGKARHLGEHAKSVGLRRGDVVVSAGGRSDLVGVQHFHAWWRLTRSPGETVAVEVLRGKQRRTFELTAQE
jgi:hypothetical protein